jgi:hypothetical protein
LSFTTKHGKPVAKLIPIHSDTAKVIGSFKGNSKSKATSYLQAQVGCSILISILLYVFADESEAREQGCYRTDCGPGGRVHPQIARAKLRALRDGRRSQAKKLWS